MLAQPVPVRIEPTTKQAKERQSGEIDMTKKRMDASAVEARRKDLGPELEIGQRHKSAPVHCSGLLKF